MANNRTAAGANIQRTVVKPKRLRRSVRSRLRKTASNSRNACSFVTASRKSCFVPARPSRILVHPAQEFTVQQILIRLDE
jgi:hypothetical protein